MSRFLYRLGRFAARRPWVVISIWLAIAVSVIAGSASFGRELTDDNRVPGLDSQRALDLLARTGAGEDGVTAQLVITREEAGATFFNSQAAIDDLAKIQQTLATVPNLKTIGDPAAALTQGEQAATEGGFVSTDGRVAVIRLQYPLLEQLRPADLTRLKAAITEADAGPLQVEGGGELFFHLEKPATGIGEVAGLLVAVVVLLAAFGSVIAAGLPLGTALLGLGIGISSLSLVTYLVEIPAFATVMASMVGLGAGIDYALFVVTRHREQLAEGLDPHESIAQATATAGRAVVFAGGTVVVSILGLSVAGLPFLTAAGLAMSLVVLIMVASAISLLPAFLSLAGTRINSRRSARRSEAAVPARWAAWASHVTRHPVRYAIGGAVMLLAMSAPVLAIRLGVPDEGTLPPSRTERRAYDLVSGSFGPGTNGPLLIAADLSKITASGDADRLAESLRSSIAADAGIAFVAPAHRDPASGVAVIVATPRTAPQDKATKVTVDRLRGEVFPEVLRGQPATAHVGGQTAGFSDLSDRVQQRLPWFIGAVVVLSFLLLTLVFRSILVPLKAAILNLLSIGAAYGVLVMVFQWEWAGALIGLEGPVPIVSFIPMLMFAIVFGLSMDYEVFLLSRVREHYDSTGDNTGAVVHGLSSTARVITSAALIMVSVFLGFVFGDDPTVKMLGLGLATAIFIDATIVRMILVPATMTLLGNANWWLPARFASTGRRMNGFEANLGTPGHGGPAC